MAKRDYYPGNKFLKLLNLVVDYFGQDLVRDRRSFGANYG